ncbi:hypothetical protein A6V36_29020 [Paraburkholderia ginsengiterrae]|uniref:Uncharacterized protein n=1 Tax=Paraburkholderia ginsengiterrae TaxID=1462993 RepID=A0A1A9MYE6_9BURK|nr:hypothetical protein A6V37_09165 [Paraburkholderia ginsengiterrae]OAJ59088.1 hypothetical protein A6V36_29020 [Paraburkholderia ginsengiterrae]
MPADFFNRLVRQRSFSVIPLAERFPIKLEVSRQATTILPQTLDSFIDGGLSTHRERARFVGVDFDVVNRCPTIVIVIIRPTDDLNVKSKLTCGFERTKWSTLLQRAPIRLSGFAVIMRLITA